MLAKRKYEGKRWIINGLIALIRDEDNATVLALELGGDGAPGRVAIDLYVDDPTVTEMERRGTALDKRETFNCFVEKLHDPFLSNGEVKTQDCRLG